MRAILALTAACLLCACAHAPVQDIPTSKISVSCPHETLEITHPSPVEMHRRFRCDARGYIDHV